MSQTWDATYDFVVVGSGGGAMTAAYTAARLGLSTLIVEKTDRLGGTSAYSGGACWLPGSDVQQRAGLPDSVESARAYLTAVIPDIDPDKLEAFLAGSPELVGFLESDEHIGFEWIPFPEYYAAKGRVGFGRSIQPTNLPAAELGDRLELVRPPVERDREGLGQSGKRLSGGQALIGRLLIAATATGNATVRTETSMDELVVEDGRVVGIGATAPEGRVHIGARRGVLLAAGGFEHNPELRAKHGVPGTSEWSMAPAGTNVGEPMLAAQAIGAASANMSEGWFCPGLAMPDGRGSFTLGFRSGFMVDSTGRRYANESLAYDRFGREMAKDPARIPSYYVFDSREGGRLPAIAMPEGDPAHHLEAGTWVRADTVEELAELIGVPAGNLAKTVETFNGYAEAGVDEDFHRGEDEYDSFFAPGEGPNKCLTPLDQPPFYAARFVLSDLGTKGGVVTDVDGRALREDGSAIAGLFVSSNTSASMAGAYYPAPGVPLGTAMVFAYRAVRRILAD
jgi:3-oxosteroid 1-dehydrogenase